jgi:hypothetical protein
MVFLPNICACPVECETYSSGVMLKDNPLNVKQMPVVIFFADLDLKEKTSFLDGH